MKRTSVLPSLLFLFASGLLCWNLGVRYLWQDEAATAVLAERLLSYGRPLGYDGRNLITMDRFRPEEAQLLPTRSAEDAVQFFVEREDFKSDTTWVGQPWGQFLTAGISLAILGRSTFVARLPFALAGALAALLLFLMVRDRFAATYPALIAFLLLLGNTFWFLHVRQCRYYALSALFLLITLETYLRWRERRRWGIAGFIVAAGLWFQQDFGSVWPVLGVLALDGIITGRRKRLGETVAVFVGLGLSLAPFVVYYELTGRIKETYAPWSTKLWSTVFQMNQFQMPLLLVVFAAVALFLDRHDPGTRRRRRLVLLCLMSVAALTVWMPTVGPFPFYRYLIPVTGPSVIVAVYCVVRLVEFVPRPIVAWIGPPLASILVFVLLGTNLVSWPGMKAIPEEPRLAHYASAGVRPELDVYLADLAGATDDPNRGAVEFLRKHAKPDDEILCNYEDIPLMFYLPNRIRGGIGAFRVADPVGRVRFAVLRSSVVFYHDAVFRRALGRRRWRAHALDVPDITWGNNPDPRFAHTLLSAGARRLVVRESIP